MNELFFPVVGAMLVFFVVVPLLTLAARSAVALLPVSGNRVSAQESPWRFLLVVGPTLGPLITRMLDGTPTRGSPELLVTLSTTVCVESRQVTA